jgi:hypothetical protein
MNRQSIILNKHLQASLKTVGATVPEQTKEFILRAMNEWAQENVNFIQKDLDKERKRIIFMIFGVFTSVTWETFILAIRNRNLKRYKRIYQKISNEDHRKYYIIRSTAINYKVLSTSDVNLNKRLRILGKFVDAKKLTETADCTITPKK